MQAITVNDIKDLLGKQITLTQRLQGFTFEHSGEVVGVLRPVIGSGGEFILDEENGDTRFYSLHEVAILRIE